MLEIKVMFACEFLPPDELAHIDFLLHVAATAAVIRTDTGTLVLLRVAAAVTT
jgi:hypothetical protein